LGRGEAEEAGGASKSLIPRRSSAPPAKSYQHLGRATPVKKALPSSKRALGSSKAPSVGSAESAKGLSGSKVRAVSGHIQQANKALTSSGHHDFQGELAAQTKRSRIPSGKKGAVKG